MDFGYTAEEEKFRERLSAFLDKELTEEIARQNWEDLGVGPEKAGNSAGSWLPMDSWA